MNKNKTGKKQTTEKINKAKIGSLRKTKNTLELTNP